MSTVILFEIVKGEGEDEGERDADIWKIESKQAGLYVFEPSTFISIYAFSFFFFFVFPILSSFIVYPGVSLVVSPV